MSALGAFFLTAPLSAPQAQDLEWSELRAFIEINATDGDAGFQAFMDGDDWRAAEIRDPNGKKIYSVKAGHSVAEQGLTETFFESAEPGCDEEGASLSDVLMRFPAGAYAFIGKSTEHGKFDGEAVLSHALPAVPVNLAAGEDSSIVLTWDWPGPLMDAGLGNCPDEDGLAVLLSDEEDLFGFQIIVEPEEDPLVVFRIDVASDLRELVIPHDFLEGSALYKFEIVAIGAGIDPDAPGLLDPELRGNQTIAESSFCTDFDGEGLQPIENCENGE